MHETSEHTVLVTGGTQGIGLAISQAFSKRGSRVITVGRHPTEDPTPTHHIQADLTTQDGCQEVTRYFREAEEGLDVLVNNAGVARFTMLEATEDGLLEEQMAVNLLAPYRMVRDLLPQLRERRGCVINISSYFARRMLPDRPSSAYSMTKGGLDALTGALAFELGPEGVRVNGIAPGTVDTPLFRQNLAALPEQSREAFRQAVPRLYPLGRLGQPGDVAALACFLASAEAGWMTGAVVPVDGGLTTH
ncbi:SDR family NAD(P)-dependent oxidoreductase [Vreelandella utahensis]|uniref:SDR family NAD(P)-dependent oxidoreductase n=1 Tax=Vreelandella halophila TaxID=86177 RepID=UPI000986FF05|nr:SDR family oxidoreductase [Halomonas utahensis]